MVRGPQFEKRCHEPFKADSQYKDSHVPVKSRSHILNSATHVASAPVMTSMRSSGADAGSGPVFITLHCITSLPGGVPRHLPLVFLIHGRCWPILFFFNKLEIRPYPMIPHFRKSVAVWTVPEVRRLVFTYTATCRLTWVWSTGGMIMTGKGAGDQGIRRRACSSAISHHEPHTGFNLDCTGVTGGTDQTSGGCSLC